MARGVKGGGGGTSRRRRGARGGRSLVAIVLLGFFAVAMGVIARRTFGIDQARSLRGLVRQRDALDAERVKLEVDIRDLSSRARLGPVVEQRLRMYVPADSQIILLPRPTPARK